MREQETGGRQDDYDTVGGSLLRHQQSPVGGRTGKAEEGNGDGRATKKAVIRSEMIVRELIQLSSEER